LCASPLLPYTTLFRSQLLLDRHRGGARPGGLTTDVDHVRTVDDQGMPPGDGSLVVQTLATIRERVRGHVDDPHDQHHRLVPLDEDRKSTRLNSSHQIN